MGPHIVVVLAVVAANFFRIRCAGQVEVHM